MTRRGFLPEFTLKVSRFFDFVGVMLTLFLWGLLEREVITARLKVYLGANHGFGDH